MRLTLSQDARAFAGRALALAVFLLFVAATGARAQANNGAPDLLLPIGARATALGGAFVAEQGSEAIWWNPAGLARLAKPEFALDHFENVFIKGDAASLVVPIQRVGAFGISGRFYNLAQTDSTDAAGNQLGTIYLRTVMVGATFAAPFGPNVAAGVTYHVYQSRADCSGICTSDVATTSALDAGVQLRPFPTRPLVVGVEVRNLGPKLQVRDKPQADALPTRLHLGATYDPSLPQLPPDLRVRANAEIVTTTSFGLPEFRVGGQIGFANAQSTLLARAGYVYQPSVQSSGSGPSLGLGLAQGRVSLDITRIFETFSSGLGTPPTYISIRVGL